MTDETNVKQFRRNSAKAENEVVAAAKPLAGLSFIDLFAGIGGFHYALNRYGAECVFASEWDTAAQDTYEINHGIRPHGDITKIDCSAIPSHDVICGGFPCQAFSISGKQLGLKDARGTLFFDVARVAEYHKPKLLLLENVKNFEKHDKGRTLETLKKILSSIGYTVFHKVMDASKYGSPQKRERIYILAFREDLNVTQFKFPEPLETIHTVSSILQGKSESKGMALTRKDIVLKDKSTYPVEPVSGTKRIGYVNKGGQGERIYHPLGNAITLSAYGGGAGAKTGLYLINRQVRRLTTRECARLLGLPENFVINGNKQQAYKQFGNSVVVNVLEALLAAIVEQRCLNPVFADKERVAA